MAESISLQTLERVNTESQRKVKLVNLCIKAQQDLAHKLRKESQRRTEICYFVRNSNLQLETEIRNAAEEINTMSAAYESMKSANVELKKELLLSKENNLEMIERMKNGEKTYDELWLQSKKRFESIPFVQEWLQATKKTETLMANIDVLENEAKVLHNDIKTKNEVLQELDRKQIVRLAKFLVVQMPAGLEIIAEKSDKINKLAVDIDVIIKEQEIKNKKMTGSGTLVANVDVPPPFDDSHTKVLDDKWPNLGNNINDSLMIPRLERGNTQLDVINVKLELSKLVINETATVKRSNSITEFENNANIRIKSEGKPNGDFISSYFTKPVRLDASAGHSDTTKYYSKKKLINILEDFKLDESETFNMMAKVNPDKLTEVIVIGADTKTNSYGATSKNSASIPLDSEEAKEIDLTKSSSQNLLNPPTQFLDVTQVLRSVQNEVEIIVDLSMDDVPFKNTLLQLKNTQENVKKTVSFDLPAITEEVPPNADLNKSDIGNDTCETVNSEPEEYTPLGMILKKHKIDDLDLSPVFVYAKKKTPQQEDEKVVASKFFNQTEPLALETDETLVQSDQKEAEVIEIDEDTMDQPIQQNPAVIAEDKAVKHSKANNEAANPVTGLLFSHGPQGFPESLDISMSTTGFEDGDGDYAHGIDNSLLLSPRADVQPMSGNTDASSQEVPSFITGFRKTGLFFFGKNRQAEANPEPSAPDQEQRFNFNFGGQENKTRGLFNFFR